MNRVGDVITIYVVSNYARSAYCGAARLKAMGYESEGMDEDDLFFYSVVSTKNKDIDEILYDLYIVSNCVYAFFIIKLNKDNYIFVKPEDLWKLFGFYEYYYFDEEDCEEGYENLSDYRYCVAYEDLLYDELDEVKPGVKEIWDEKKYRKIYKGYE